MSWSITCLTAGSRQRGCSRGERESVKGELGVLVGQVRRILSVTAVRAQAECLLSRLRNFGEEAGGRKGSELGKVETDTGCG